MHVDLGPLTLSYYSGNGWTRFRASLISHRKGGLAARTSDAELGFRSQHLTEALGQDNPADQFVCPTTGTVYYGKIVQGSDGVHSISAKEVYSKALFVRATKEGLNAARTAVGANDAAPVDVSATPVAEPA